MLTLFTLMNEIKLKKKKLIYIFLFLFLVNRENIQRNVGPANRKGSITLQKAERS